jgi:hypothetical protein
MIEFKKGNGSVGYGKVRGCSLNHRSIGTRGWGSFAGEASVQDGYWEEAAESGLLDVMEPGDELDFMDGIYIACFWS